MDVNQPKYNLSDLTTFFVKHRWPWHLTFWVLHLTGRSLAYYITVLYYSKEVLILMLFSELVFAGLVYLTLWMYPRFSKLNLILIGGAIWIGYVALLASCQIYFLGALPEMSELTWMTSFLGNIKLYLITFILLILAKYFKDSFIQQWYDDQQKKLQLQSELQNLKAQVSPHFLFNTMNNFYGLAVARSDKLPDLMVRLSDLLRYSLYETQSTTVPLHREISYLKNYIALEKIRLEDDLIFEFNTALKGNHDLNIAPLLLIVPVENAFKHAKNVVAEPINIKIDLDVDTEGTLWFQVRNNCLENRAESDDENGIGLENLRRRLQAMYPENQHVLTAEQKEGSFEVSLKINLQNIAL